MTRILVVEDDASIRLGLEDTLRAKGYEVAVVTRGEDAVELADRWHPQLIILDIMLPDIDGFEVCRRIKSPRSALANVPVIMLSGKTQFGAEAEGLAAGANFYMWKPMKTPELLTNIRTVLEQVTVPV